jgi:hypothetical protein
MFFLIGTLSIHGTDQLSLQVDIVTLRIHVAELELADDQLETKLRRYRQALNLLEKDMNVYKNHMKLYTSELAFRGIEINSLSEKIMQLINNNNDSSNSTTATPSPHTAIVFNALFRPARSGAYIYWRKSPIKICVLPMRIRKSNKGGGQMLDTEEDEEYKRGLC